MSNTLLTIDDITNEALDVFHNRCILARNSNRSYDPAFAKEGAKIGTALRVRLPNQYTVTTGAAMTAQDTTEQYVTINNATQFHVAMDFTSVDLTMKMSDFSEKIIVPAVSKLATKVDLFGHQSIYKEAFNSVGTPGSTPSTALALLQANQKMNEFAVPEDGRSFIMNPAAQAAMVDGLKGLFTPTGVLDSQFKKGKMASGVLGYDEIAMSQNVAMHTTGAWGTTITVTATGTEGASTLGISFTGASKTWKEGDVFTIANVYAINPDNFQSTGSLQQFVVTADASGSSTATLSIAPSLITTGALKTIDSLPQTGAAITMLGSASTPYPQNLAYWQRDVAFVTADLVMPHTGKASRKVMDGVSMRVWQFSDGFNDAHPCRIDVLCGWKLLRRASATRVWG